MTVTCQCAIAPSASWPRTLSTSNQSRLRTVLRAWATALDTAASMPSGEVPTTSEMEYTRSAMACPVFGGPAGRPRHASRGTA